jgi:PBS lyase HEAT-like repeat
MKPRRGLLLTRETGACRPSGSAGRRLGLVALTAVVLQSLSGSAQLDDACFVSALNRMARAQPETPTVELNLQLEEPVVTLGEPVFADLWVHNRLSEPVDVDLGWDKKGNIRLHVVDPAGGRLQLQLQRPAEGGMWFPGVMKVGPESKIQQRLLLNEWVSFPSVGRYIVELALGAPARDRSGAWVATAGAAPVSLEVSPRDEATLRRVCEELVQPALSFDVKTATEAAAALSYIQDPVALPYLKRVLLGGGPGADFAIEGLARNASERAIEVLVGAFDSLKDFEKLQVQVELTRLRESVVNPDLRREIDRLLSQKIELWLGQEGVSNE